MYYTGLTGLLKLTKAQYDAIDHDENTKYIVKNGDSVQEYLGDIPIGGSAYRSYITGTPALIMSGVILSKTDTIYGTAEEVE